MRRNKQKIVKVAKLKDGEESGDEGGVFELEESENHSDIQLLKVRG